MIDYTLLEKDIARFLESKDRTNRPENKALAFRYAEACTEFNKLAAECETYIRRNMLIEANRYASGQTPSMQKQAELFRMHGIESLGRLFDIYEWEMECPVPRLDILDSLTQHLNDQKDVTPFVNAFRKIVREPALEPKVALLRKIVSLAPDVAEWHNTLTTMEKQRLQELTDQAKTAICAQDYTALEEIHRELSSPDWTEKPHPLVLKKVNKVWEEHRQSLLKVKAEACLEHVNDAYSNFDYDTLQNELQNWYYLIDDEKYIAEEYMLLQVKEAENYYTEQKKIRDEEADFQSRITALRNGVANEQPLSELEPVYNQLKLTGRKLPAVLEKKFLSYKETMEEIMRRKQLVRIAVIASAAFVVIILAVVLTSLYVLQKSEQEWTVKIENALASEPSSVAFDLLDKLEKSSPSVRYRSGIVALETKAAAKQQKETEQYEFFSVLLAQVRKDLRNFVKTKSELPQKLAELEKAIASSQERTLYKEVDLEYQKQLKEYLDRQGKQYVKLAFDLFQLKKNFFIAIGKCDCSEAEKLYDKMLVLKKKSEELEDVPEKEKNIYLKTFEEVPELKQKLLSAGEYMAKMKAAVETVRQTTDSAQLKSAVDSFIEEYPGHEYTEYAKKLKANLLRADYYAPQDPFDDSVFHVFQKDAGKFAKVANAQKQIQEAMKAEFETMNNNYTDNPVYMLAITSKDKDKIYDFYFYEKDVSNAKWGRIANAGNCKVRCAINESDVKETNLKFRFRKANDDHIALNDFAIEVTGGSLIQGKLVFPAPDEFVYRAKRTLRHEAPHTTFIKTLYERLSNAKPQKAESILVSALKNLFDDEFINPYLKLILAKKIVTGLTSNYEDSAPQYQELQEKLEEIEANTTGVKWMQSYLQAQMKAKEKLAKELKALQISTLSVDMKKYFYRRLQETALSRKIEPAGYLIKNGKNQWQITGLRSNNSSGELWLAMEEAPYWRVIGTYAGHKINIPYAEAGNLQEMQILYTPCDGRSTKDLKARMLRNAEEYGIKESDIQWPETWPVITEAK